MLQSMPTSLEQDLALLARAPPGQAWVCVCVCVRAHACVWSAISC